MSIQSITAVKNEICIKITFPTPFPEPPVVIVSSVYSHPNQIACQETITSISKTGCTITSGNMDPDYHVNVLAISPGLSAFGDLKLLAGSSLKAATQLQVSLGRGLSSPDPVTMLASYWRGSAAGVETIDTLDDSGTDEFSVFSGNLAPRGYYTQYLASDIGVGREMGKILHTGIANKPAKGSLKVYFSQPFSAPPTVVVSPWYDDAHAGVHAVDVLVTDQVTKDYFVLASTNAASNYFVNWMALGS